jgi:hypothetical protein
MPILSRPAPCWRGAREGSAPSFRDRLRDVPPREPINRPRLLLCTHTQQPCPAISRPRGVGGSPLIPLLAVPQDSARQPSPVWGVVPSATGVHTPGDGADDKHRRQNLTNPGPCLWVVPYGNSEEERHANRPHQKSDPGDPHCCHDHRARTGAPPRVPVHDAILTPSRL